MPEPIRIDAPNAEAAAALLAAFRGRFRAESVEGDGGWEVRVYPDEPFAGSVEDVLPAVRSWLAGERLEETTVHLDGRAHTLARV
jgi:hypothetical protein